VRDSCTCDAQMLGQRVDGRCRQRRNSLPVQTKRSFPSPHRRPTSAVPDAVCQPSGKQAIGCFYEDSDVKPA